MSQDPEQKARIMSEHAKRDGLPHSEVEAAYRYVDKLLDCAEKTGGGYLWYDWSMREAFLAGCSHVRAQKPEPEPAQEQRFVEFTRAFPPAQLTIKGDGKTLDALIEKECISLFDVDRILRDQVPVEGVVHGDTGFQVQWKEGSGATEPDPNSFTGKRAGLAPSYDWWVVDSSGKWPAEGTTDSLDDAVFTGRLAMAKVSPMLHPCVLRVCERKLVVEESSGGIDRASKVESDLDTDSTYHWEVRDMEDQFQAGGQASALHEAMSNARSYAYQYALCKVRVWTERTIHEATFDG